MNREDSEIARRLPESSVCAFLIWTSERETELEVAKITAPSRVVILVKELEDTVKLEAADK